MSKDVSNTEKIEGVYYWEDIYVRVVSVEMAQRLKDNGYEQECGEFIYIKGEDDSMQLIYERDDEELFDKIGESKEFLAAPTCGDLVFEFDLDKMCRDKKINIADVLATAWIDNKDYREV